MKKRVLTNEQVREIRRLWHKTRNLSQQNPNKWTCGRLGTKFHVHRSTIFQIVNWETYQEVFDVTDSSKEIQSLIYEAYEDSEPPPNEWIAVPLRTLQELLAEHAKLVEGINGSS